MEDAEAQKSPTGEKHTIDSFVHPTSPTMSTEESTGSSPRPQLNSNANHPRIVRSADHLNIAQNKQVEGKQAKASVGVEHIVKIFSDNDDDFIEGA
jgi:hypothetical protein